MEPSPANFHDWQRLATSFESMGAYSSLAVSLGGVGEPEQLEGAVISGDLFAMLGAHPAIGRALTAADDRPEAPRVALLSDGLWRRRFGADPAILGRSILLNQIPYTVIGVMPRGFFFPVRTAELWRTFQFTGDDYIERSNNYLRVIARLRRGSSFSSAEAEMRLVAAQLERAWPKDNQGVGARVTTLRDEVSSGSRMLLLAILAAAACVLLIGCTNLANLLLARALSRRRELAVRAAIGAGRERLIRQLLTESLMLALAGGGAGVLLAMAALPMLVRLVPTSLPIAEVPAIDGRVLGFAALLTVLTGVAFGVLPALRACGGMNLSGLREGSRGGVGGRRERLRSALVIAEVAGSVVLLVCCGLLLRALWRVQSIDPGFRANGVLTLRTTLPMPRYVKVADRERYYVRVLGEARRLPGVSSAAFVSFVPMSPHGGIFPVSVPGRDPDPKSRGALLRYVTPGYFATLGIPLLAGRDADSRDAQDAPYTVVVSEAFARRYWPGENPLGRRMQIALAERTVVGVVGEIRARGLERISEPQVYLPHRQVGRWRHYLVRAEGSGAARIGAGSGTDSRAPADHRGRRPGPAGERCGDARRGHRFADRAAPGAGAGAGRVRRDCVSAGRDRDSRAAGIFGLHAAAGDRRPRGIGGTAGRDSGHDFRRVGAALDRGHCAWRGDCVLGGKRDARAARRFIARRPAHLWGGGWGLPGDDGDRFRIACAARAGGGPGERNPGRVMFLMMMMQ